MARTSRRLRRAAIIGLEILAGATLGFMVLMGVTIWRLSQGPIEISFLSPTIEDALSDPERGFAVEVGATQLSWEGWARGLDIHLRDVSARDADGVTIAEIGDMTVAFSLRALATGALVPTRLEVIAPSILLTYDPVDGLSFGHADAPSGDADISAPDDEPLGSMVIEELMRAPDVDRRFGGLRSFEIRDANMRVFDDANGVVWETPGANMILRRDDGGLNVEAALAIRLEQDVTFFDISGYFDRERETVRIAAGFDQIRPSLLAGQLDYLADFADFDRPVSGRISADLQADRADFSLRLDVTFDEVVGSVEATGHSVFAEQRATVNTAVSNMPLSELAAGLPWLAPFIGFNVIVAGESQLVVKPSGIESAGFSVSAGSGTVLLPEQLDRPLNIVSIAFEGAMAGAGEALDIARAEIEFGTSRFVGAASAFADEAGGFEISVDGSLSELLVADAGLYWPSALARNGRNWVNRRITDGKFDRVDLDLYGRLDAESYGFEPYDTRIAFAFSDVSLIYIEEMPPLVGMRGTGVYDGESLQIDLVEGASTFDLAAGPGRVVVSGFENPTATARITARLRGDARDHFRMLDHEPLGFLTGYGIAPDEVIGQGDLNLDIAIELLEVVALEAIDVSVAATMNGATVPGIVAGLPLTDASLRITASNAALAVEGSGRFNDVPVEFELDEAFGNQTQSTLRGVFDAAQLTDLGLDAGRWASGPISLAARFTEYRDGTSRADVALDLSAAAMAVPEFAWSKPPGSAADASFSLALRDAVPFAIERFTVNAGDLALTGRAQFTADGEFRSADIERLAVGRTAIAGRLEVEGENGATLRIDGGTFDLKPLLEAAEDDDSDETDELVSILASLDRLWISEDGYLNQVAGTVQFQGATWINGQINASSSSGAPLQLTIEPAGSGRFLRLTADDAGSVLRDLGLVNSLRDGRLVVAARFRDGEPGRPLVGDIDVSDFRLVDAPLLASIVSIAGVTGILDALQGAGIGFGRLATTFRFDEGIIEFREGRMVGPSLGITFEGTVDVDRDLVDLRGAVAPAYAVNGILGDIPLIGDILVGGEGEGIFAVTYQASGAAGDPQVAVNPLSALTPGVLRNIFPGG